jgi:hypothetical protein
MNVPSVHPALMALLAGGSQPPLSLDHSMWDRLAGEAERHDLTSWLHRWSGNHPSAVPAPIRENLKARAAALAGRNLILADELAAILHALDRRGIRCAPLRGFALAHYLPDAPSVRPMGDLDLLVRREDYAGLREALTHLGYVETDRRPGFAEAYSYTLEFVKDRHGWITVEPHWTLAYPPFMDSIDMAGVWKRCRRGTVAGIETWLLSPEDLLVNLCWHLQHKGVEAPLLWWHELDQLLRRCAPDIDWSLVTAAIGPGAQAGLLAEVLAALMDEFHSPIPSQAMAALERSAPPRAHRGIRLFTGPLDVDGAESLAQFLAIRGFGARSAYAWSLLFPSREFMMRHYQPASPLQLCLRYAGRVLACAWEGLKGLVNLCLPARRPSLP